MEILGRLPEPVRRVLRDRIDAARETVDIVSESLAGRSVEPPLPPNWLRDVGLGDFEKTGQDFLRYFIELASLQPKEVVLDIGCGPGRMTLPLIGYLREGSYFGIDVNARAIRWCRRNISSRAPGFTFYHADIFNQRYNPSGKLGASEYVFPFDDDSLDFIFLTSVVARPRMVTWSQFGSAMSISTAPTVVRTVSFTPAPICDISTSCTSGLTAA